MAIATDITVAVNGDIRYVGTTANYTVLELHRFLQNLADDQQAATASLDYLDISSPTPSVRSTDQIVTLNAPYNIDDTLAEHLYGGSITQASGGTQYSGLRVLGSVATAATQIQIVQDNKLYDGDAPFWGTQAAPYNGGGSVLFRILVKSRQSGYNIDGKRIRVRAGNYGDAYASFEVELGLAESVAAVSTVADPQNTTAHGTIAAWAGGDIPTNTEGYQSIDIGDGSGAEPYYSKWTYNTNALEMRAIWEWAKYANEVGSAKTLHGLDGELFRGITHSYAFNGGSSALTEDEIVAWGTKFWYDALSGGTFTEGYYVTIGALGASGRIGYDDGVDEIVVALGDTTITLANNDVITEYNPATGAATGVTAALDTVGGAITNNDKEGGTGILLAATGTTTGSHYLQLVSGLAPVASLPIIGATSGFSVAVNGAVTARTIPSVYLGNYTGSLIGAYGIGIDPDDLSSGDTVANLTGQTRNAPNNVTYTLSGVTSGEDYVLVMKKHASNADFDFAEMTLATALVGAAETQIDVGVGNVPLDAPASGVLRVTLDDGRHRRIAYNTHDTRYFYITSSSWVDPNDAAIGKGVSLAFIDKLATGSNESFIIKYNAARTLWQRVRDGGTAGDALPIVTWEQTGSLSATGGSALVSRVSDA